MNIRQAIYEKSEPPKDRPILSRFKPAAWPHHVIWNGEAWQLMGRAIVKSDDEKTALLDDFLTDHRNGYADSWRVAEDADGNEISGDL